MTTLKNEILKQFTDKYEIFELCEVVNKKDYDKLKSFLSDVIDRVEEKRKKDLSWIYENLQKQRELPTDKKYVIDGLSHIVKSMISSQPQE